MLGERGNSGGRNTINALIAAKSGAEAGTGEGSKVRVTES